MSDSFEGTAKGLLEMVSGEAGAAARRASAERPDCFYDLFPTEPQRRCGWSFLRYLGRFPCRVFRLESFEYFLFNFIL